MKSSTFVFIIIGLIAVGLLAGCSSSQESQNTSTPPTEEPTPQQPAYTPPPAAAQKVPEKVDTVTVLRQDTQHPAYAPPSSPTMTGDIPKGNCSIQIGAFKMPDNADRIIALAKQRFNQPVYLFLDQTDTLYKVMIGDFPTKDAARSFRDAIAQQYPGDYKDAWVWEKPHQ
ncbi:MAG TPA: SPOR domain-containing protein [Bacteroidota bacterium]|nr:SPOR domain-containing protein [Bacteroidota bacterium]